MTLDQGVFLLMLELLLVLLSIFRFSSVLFKNHSMQGGNTVLVIHTLAPST